MSEPAIALSQVCVSLGGHEVLHNVSFTVERPGLVGVVGPNGGGKSTLMKVLMGLIAPSHGKVRLYGSTPRQMVKRLGYVPQKLPFDRKFPVSVKELVMTGLLSELNIWGRFGKRQKEKGFFWLEQLGLLELSERPIGTLSGGQLQRALIARALVSKPDILLLDEALEGVDQKNQSFLLSYLKELSQKVVVLMVTHDFVSCRALADQLLVVQAGVEQVSASALCDHFSLGLYHAKKEEQPFVKGCHLEEEG